MQGYLVEQTTLNHLVEGLTMELEVHLSIFLHIFKQIENILLNKLPLWIELIVVDICSKVGLFVHHILIWKIPDVHHLGWGTRSNML
jgi:hypothetical protein